MEHNQSSMEEPRLDEFFRDKMEDFTPPPYDAGAWAKLEPRMAAPMTSPVLWYWISGVLGFLLIFSWLYFLSVPSGERQIVQQLDSLQQQLSKLAEAQNQIQKDTVFVYLSSDSLNQQTSKTYTSDSLQRTLTQAQNHSIGRSANSRTSPSFNPQTEVNSPSALPEGDIDVQSPSKNSSLINPKENAQMAIEDIDSDIASPIDSSSFVGIPSGNDQPDKTEQENRQTSPKKLDQVEAFVRIDVDSTSLSEDQITLDLVQGDSLMTLAETQTSPRDSSLSVRPQPQTPVKKVRSRILQNWLQTREIRAGLQMGGGSLWANNTASGFQSNGGLYFATNLNHRWWVQTGIDLYYRNYEGENEDASLPQDILDALPGLVDPISPAELKEFYMKGVSIGIPLGIRREFYLNRNWELGVQASLSAHRYVQQRFDYQSFTEEEVRYLSRGVEQQWTLSPLRLTVMGIHNDRFSPSIGIYAEYDLMARGVEPIRFWSAGLQASFGLQLK